LAETFSTRGLKALFGYPFHHPKWEGKVVVLALLCLAGFFLPILPWLPVLGYAAEIMRRASNGEGDPDLPEWEDWGRLFLDGLRIGGAALVAILPLILVFICGFSAYFASLLGVIMENSDSRSASIPAFIFAGNSFFILMMICGLLLTLLIFIPLPAALVHVAHKRSFAALFDVSGWWRVFSANIGGFLIGILLLWAVSFMMQILTNILVSTVVLCVFAFIAPILMVPYLVLISSLMYGQIYREGLETLELPAPEPVEEGLAI
jgi:hypothetical protein